MFPWIFFMRFRTVTKPEDSRPPGLIHCPNT